MHFCYTNPVQPNLEMLSDTMMLLVNAGCVQKQILSWYSVFWFTKNIKYVIDNLFRCMHAKMTEKDLDLTKLLQKLKGAVFWDTVQRV